MKSKNDRSGNQDGDDLQSGVAVRSSFRAQKQKAVIAAARDVDPKADARQAFGFMPVALKGSHIRWRGL